MTSTGSRSARIRSRLSHPIIAADGHIVECTPVLLDYLPEVGGPAVPDRYPTSQVYVQVTAGAPAQLARRREERGIKGGAKTKNWRVVTNYGIGPEDVDHALDVVEGVFREYARG